jgi:hypothetical protein
LRQESRTSHIDNFARRRDDSTKGLNIWYINAKADTSSQSVGLRCVKL